MITYTLINPIVFGSETITQLNVREPKLKSLRKMDGIVGDFTRTAKMIELLCDIPPSQVDELSLADINAIAELINGFLPSSQQTH